MSVSVCKDGVGSAVPPQRSSSTLYDNSVLLLLLRSDLCLSVSSLDLNCENFTKLSENLNTCRYKCQARNYLTMDPSAFLEVEFEDEVEEQVAGMGDLTEDDIILLDNDYEEMTAAHSAGSKRPPPAPETVPSSKKI